MSAILSYPQLSSAILVVLALALVLVLVILARGEIDRIVQPTETVSDATRLHLCLVHLSKGLPVSVVLDFVESSSRLLSTLLSPTARAPPIPVITPPTIERSDKSSVASRAPSRQSAYRGKTSKSSKLLRI
jgi:hypothetical protein